MKKCSNTENVIIKLVIGALGLTLCYWTFVSGTTEYHQSIVQENAIIWLKKVQNNQMSPLETLTNILYTTENMSPQGKVTYLLEFKTEIIAFINKTPNNTNTKDQIQNLNELLDFVSKEINNAKIEADKQALVDFIYEYECKKYKKDGK